MIMTSLKMFLQLKKTFLEQSNFVQSQVWMHFIRDLFSAKFLTVEKLFEAQLFINLLG